MDNIVLLGQPGFAIGSPVVRTQKLWAFFTMAMEALTWPSSVQEVQPTKEIVTVTVGTSSGGLFKGAGGAFTGLRAWQEPFIGRPLARLELIGRDLIPPWYGFYSLVATVKVSSSKICQMLNNMYCAKFQCNCAKFHLNSANFHWRFSRILPNCNCANFHWCCAIFNQYCGIV